MQPRTRPVAVVILVSVFVVFPVSMYAAGAEQRTSERVVGLKYKERATTEFLKAVLKAMNLRYTVTSTADGELVEWPSTDPAQLEEIQDRVSQFWFISTQCPGMPLPSPSELARARRSC